VMQAAAPRCDQTPPGRPRARAAPETPRRSFHVLSALAVPGRMSPRHRGVRGMRMASGCADGIYSGAGLRMTRFAFVMGLDELSPVGGRAAGLCYGNVKDVVDWVKSNKH
jgi:hypothetical protein